MERSVGVERFRLRLASTAQKAIHDQARFEGTGCWCGGLIWFRVRPGCFSKRTPATTQMLNTKRSLTAFSPSSLAKGCQGTLPHSTPYWTGLDAEFAATAKALPVACLATTAANYAWLSDECEPLQVECRYTRSDDDPYGGLSVVVRHP